MMIRLASVLVGLAILGAAAHVNIAYTGGYNTPHAILTLAVAAGLAVLGGIWLLWARHAAGPRVPRDIKAALHRG